jgi:phage/plasmid-associated DNA primase
MRPFYLKRNKRLIISNEVSLKNKLDGTIIKSVSGNDVIEGRLHGGNELNFRYNFLPIISCNQIPEFSLYDDAVDLRCKFFTYNKVFVENPDLSKDQLQIDYNINNEIQTYEFQNTLFNLFCYYFKNKDTYKEQPIECIKNKEDWVGE